MGDAVLLIYSSRTASPWEWRPQTAVGYQN